MGFFDVLKSADGKAWRDAIIWLFLNLFASALPIGGSYFLIHNMGQAPILREPVRHGELALISLSLLASAVYIIARGVKISGIPSSGEDPEESGIGQLGRLFSRISFPGLLGFIPSIFILAILSTFVFAVAISADFMGVSNLTLIDSRIVYSGILLLLSLTAAFLITVVDTAIDYSRPDVRSMVGENYERWLDSVNGTWEELE